jgi:hypothetical protein
MMGMKLGGFAQQGYEVMRCGLFGMKPEELATVGVTTDQEFEKKTK